MKKRKRFISRRDFLSKTTSGVAAVGIFGVSGNTVSLNDEEKLKGDIIYRTLGSTGIKLPIVNMGVMNAFNPELVKKSYEIGVRHFDTAAYYQRGLNEKMVGKVIKELNVRDKVVIATKVYIPPEQRKISSNQAKDFFLKTAEESLKRLQTDYIDILYVHNVYDVDYLNNPGIREAMERLKKQKKIRFIGFSTHRNMTECIIDAVAKDFYEVILTTFNYALAEEKNLQNALKNAAARGIGVIAMKTQCTQYWYRQRYVPANYQNYYKGKIKHTSVLKWVLKHPYISSAIPGYTTFEQMEEDFSVAYNLEYTKEEKKFLEDRNIKLSMGYCHQCNRCISSCPRGVDIPTLMRVHMYAACYSNFYHARDTLDDIPVEKSLQACVSCGKCVAECANRIDITRRIDELKTIYT
ncbi:MAG: aldo/keto reductase [Candidatus Aminicenantes bacterium]|nr:aldo/keto reductase [Candidatus Aminicenantes bacterium]